MSCFVAGPDPFDWKLPMARFWPGRRGFPTISGDAKQSVRVDCKSSNVWPHYRRRAAFLKVYFRPCCKQTDGYDG